MAQAAELVTEFVAGRRGWLHQSLFVPEQKPRGVVLVAQAFAEEANKSRRMLALQARALAHQGYLTVIPDMFGCGDSEGDFLDARWEDWIADTRDLAQAHARRWDAEPVLLGVRVGALLAAAALAELAECRRLVFWQPVVSGEPALTQFLRIRAAASMMEGQRETPAQLRAVLQAGDPVEVAGYELHPELAQSLASARLEPVTRQAGRLHCFLLGAEGAAIPPPVAGRLEQWAAAGWDCRPGQLVGDPFWTTQEITEVPELLEATTSVFARREETA